MNDTESTARAIRHKYASLHAGHSLRFTYDTLEVIGDIRSKYRVTHTYSNKYNRNQIAEMKMELVKFHRN